MYTIVVADDEEELRRAIIRKIDWESIGFQVVGEAENGIEALELVERMEPDLLLTDIRMPFVSGIELARQVREVRPTTQIAFLSGFDEFSYAQQAIQYNIISYMLKPITMVDLTEELKKIKLKIDGIFAEFDARKHDNPDLQQFFLPLLLDDYASFEGQDREELLQEQAVGNGFLKDRNNAFQYAVLAITVEDTNGKNRTRPELVHSVDMILQKYMKHYSFAMDGRIIAVLAATTSTFDRYLHIAVGEMVQSTERILKMHCHIGVSRIREHLGECHEAYRGAMSALGYCTPGESGIHYIADEERDNTMDMELAAECVTQMENLIRGGSRRGTGKLSEGCIRQTGGAAGCCPEMQIPDLPDVLGADPHCLYGDRRFRPAPAFCHAGRSDTGIQGSFHGTLPGSMGTGQCGQEKEQPDPV
ncbi:MAG: response regulator [Waltera sp.]